VVGVRDIAQYSADMRMRSLQTCSCPAGAMLSDVMFCPYSNDRHSVPYSLSFSAGEAVRGDVAQDPVLPRARWGRPASSESRRPSGEELHDLDDLEVSCDLGLVTRDL